jgi:hypothetical protein
MDSLLTSHEQVRHIEQDLLSSLSTISDNGPGAQVKAALALVRMKVSPVVTIHIPFGGDNHRDVDLAAETAQTLSGIATIDALMWDLVRAGLEDKVTFATLNVFGRTLGPGHENGRHHNANHQVSVVIGRAFRGGVIGGVGPVGSDYGALAIDSKSGTARSDGDVQPLDTMAAYAQTLLGAIGAPASLVKSPGGSGKVVQAALA